MNSSLNALHYDRRTIALHWLTAALVIGLWSLGQTIDWFAKGDPRVIARSVHITCGVLLAFVLATRLVWRLSGGKRLPAAGAGWLDKVASLTHVLLYLLLITTVALGLANAWIRGDNLFGLLQIPAFDPGNKELRETVEDWHGLAANTLLAVAFFHACAGLFHHLVLKDGVLRRMLPGS
ncbi:cytochrome b [soil metagenome]